MTTKSEHAYKHNLLGHVNTFCGSPVVYCYWTCTSGSYINMIKDQILLVSRVVSVAYSTCFTISFFQRPVQSQDPHLKKRSASCWCFTKGSSPRIWRCSTYCSQTASESLCCNLPYKLTSQNLRFNIHRKTLARGQDSTHAQCLMTFQ